MDGAPILTTRHLLPSIQTVTVSPRKSSINVLTCGLKQNLAIIRAPKFRRLLLSFVFLILCSLLLWVKIVGPWLKDEQATWASRSRIVDASTGGLFGSNSRPKFPGMTLVTNLDAALLPGAEAGKRRLMFIGDIHGCRKELESLLAKLEFNEQTDHLVAVGDIVNKGPDSLGVIDLLRKTKASCVRGNHEDRLLLHADYVTDEALPQENKGEEKKASSEHKAKKQLARALSHDQLAYLRSFPLVLRIGDVKGIGDIVVVHAGLVPGLPIDRQDPSSIMTMRIIDPKNHVPSKKHHLENHIHWTQLWNRFQRLLPSDSKPQMPVDAVLSRRTTVIYGHDSKRGLQLGEYTKGLDSGCVKGGKLSALVVTEGGNQEIVQVEGRDYTIKSDVDSVLQETTGSTTSGHD